MSTAVENSADESSSSFLGADEEGFENCQAGNLVWIGRERWTRMGIDRLNFEDVGRGIASWQWSQVVARRSASVALVHSRHVMMTAALARLLPAQPCPSQKSTMPLAEIHPPNGTSSVTAMTMTCISKSEFTKASKRLGAADSDPRAGTWLFRTLRHNFIAVND